MPNRIVSVLTLFSRIGLLVFVSAAGSAAALGQSVPEFYSKNPISIFTHTPSGSYDLSARLIARGLSRHLPGNPPAAVRLMVGANSVIAANHVYNVAPKDGTAIWAGARLAPYIHLMGDMQNVRFDVTKVHWLGSSASENGVVIASVRAPHRFAEDLFTHELLVGATVPGADTHLYPHALNKLLGAKFKIIPGDQSPAPIVLAIEQGELQGSGSLSWGNLVAQYPHLLSENKIRVLMQLGLKRLDALPNVPLAMDFAKNKEEYEILSVLMSVRQYSYPFFVAPGVPPDRVQALQAAFEKTLKDEDFLADSAKQGRPEGMATAAELTQAYQRAFVLPASTLDRLREVVRID